MPITQDHIMNVIAAGLDYQTAFLTYLDQIYRITELHARGAITSDQAMAEISTLSIPSDAHVTRLQNPNSPSILYAEHHYYRLHFRRNVKRRAKQEQQRRDNGILPREPYPDPFKLKHLPTPVHGRVPQPSNTRQDPRFDLAAQLVTKYEREARQAEITSFEMERAKAEASSDDEVFDPTLLDSGPPAISLTRRPRTEDSSSDD